METSVRRGLPRSVVDDVFLVPVHINAGGSVYTTTLNTLTKYPESKLAKLFDGTLAVSVDPVNRQYFLDVNGRMFAHVLDFLRYGELLLPDDFNQLPLLTKLADFFEMKEMLESLNFIEGRQNNSSQNESKNDSRVDCIRSKRERRGLLTNNASEKCLKRNIEVNECVNNVNTCTNKVIGVKDIGVGEEAVQLKANKSQVEAGPMKAKSLNAEMLKSETSEIMKVEAKTVEAESIKTGKIETGTLKSEITEMVSIGAVNVEMTSVEARAVRTESLDVGTLMALVLDVGTLKVGTLETESTSRPVKVVLVRYDEYYKVIDIYSPDELTLLNPMFPHQLIRSEYIGNCNRLYYKFTDLPCIDPHTKSKFGVPYLLDFFRQLLNRGYRFTSAIPALELNYTRDYMLICFPAPNTRP